MMPDPDWYDSEDGWPYPDEDEDLGLFPGDDEEEEGLYTDRFGFRYDPAEDDV